IVNVLHEFRTPLVTIRGYVETLLEGGLEDNENRRRFVEIIQANGVQLNNMTADLLALLELESARPKTSPRPILLRDAINSAIHAIEPAASLRSVRVLTDPISDVEVLAHSIQLEQALLNLLDNAVKFNKENGEVHISIRCGTENVEVCIADTKIRI